MLSSVLTELSFMSVNLIELVESFIVVVMKVQVKLKKKRKGRSCLSTHHESLQGEWRYNFTHS
jgi:hypothetical protein